MAKCHRRALANDEREPSHLSLIVPHKKLRILSLTSYDVHDVKHELYIYDVRTGHGDRYEKQFRLFMFLFFGWS